MIFAIAIVGLAFWQAQVAAADDAAAKHKTLPPPVKTKRAVRPSAAVFSGDVVADYVARCEKGMTDHEIGWILEDFKNAGIDSNGLKSDTPLEQLLAIRLRQHRWYHDALVDGLRLDAGQSAQVKAMLAGVLESTKNDYKISSNQSLNPPVAIPLAWMIGGGDLENFYIREPYQPWNLCILKSAQQDLTWNISTKTPNSSVSPPSPLLHRFQNSMPFGTADTGGKVPGFFEEADCLLPILVIQKLAVAENPFEEFDELLPNIRRLHPAQFRLFLLFHPQLADQIQQTLPIESR